jgi:methylenetetrahydrofolate dehydrogenase (NADP+)/methenyltetrahydrofolate cyclohydrolase
VVWRRSPNSTPTRRSTASSCNCPLPKHFDTEAVLEAIAPEKDVDGFHAENVGALMQGQPRFIPCTPYGVMKFFEEAGVKPQGQGGGRHRPLEHRRQADGHAAAARRRHGHHLPFADEGSRLHTRSAPTSSSPRRPPKFVTADMVKPGAVVIDVGINRLPDGKLCGDVDFEGVKEVAAPSPRCPVASVR